jgi:glutathione peroxidase
MLRFKKYFTYALGMVLLLSMSQLNAKGKEMSIYDIEVTNIEGEAISMSRYKGKVLLIVNVASECGFTPQYEGLEKIYQEYKDQGFMVLGFPSNQFGKQEPKDNKEIYFFCQGTYDVHFDMFAKIDVNGDNASPLYQYLKNQQSGFLWTEAIKWNFTKFLIDRQGKVIKRYGSATTPESLKDDIEKLLGQ